MSPLQKTVASALIATTALIGTGCSSMLVKMTEPEYDLATAMAHDPAVQDSKEVAALLQEGNPQAIERMQQMFDDYPPKEVGVHHEAAWYVEQTVNNDSMAELEFRILDDCQPIPTQDEISANPSRHKFMASQEEIISKANDIVAGSGNFRFSAVNDMIKADMFMAQCDISDEYKEAKGGKTSAGVQYKDIMALNAPELWSKDSTVEVAVHELLHGQGAGHDPSDNGLMAEEYGDSTSELSGHSKAEMIMKHGYDVKQAACDALEAAAPERNAVVCDDINSVSKQDILQQARELLKEKAVISGDGKKETGSRPSMLDRIKEQRGSSLSGEKSR